MVLYPYSLYAKQPQAAPVQNDEGDFVPGTPVWKLISSCRDEVNTKGETVTQVNGENVHVQATIYAPKETQILPHGTQVVVAKQPLADLAKLNDQNWLEKEILTGAIRLIDTIKGHSLTRLNIRLWV